MRRRTILTTFLIGSLVGGPTFAASNPYDLPENFDAAMRDGFTDLFNSDFDAADQKLVPLKKEAGRYPLLAVAEVMRHWWKMTENVLEADDNENKEFLASAEWAIRLGQKKLEKEDPTGQANLLIGTTLGLMSRWSAANRAWVPAYLRGSKSVSYLNKTLKRNKDAADAYMTLGTYNYAKALLAQQGGDPKKQEKMTEDQEGLAQLRKAYQEGRYLNMASGILLAGILTNENPDEALPLLVELRQQMPKSAFVHMVQITALYNSDHIDDMKNEVEDFSKKIATGTYPVSYQPQEHFSKGLIFFHQKKWEPARKEFQTGTEMEYRKNPYVTWSYLYMGYTLDAMGKRDRARKAYTAVLELPRRFASHDHARERLSRPFDPKTSVELHKLEV